MSILVNFCIYIIYLKLQHLKLFLFINLKSSIKLQRDYDNNPDGHIDVPPADHSSVQQPDLAHDDAVSNYVAPDHPDYMGICHRPFATLFQVAYSFIPGCIEERRQKAGLMVGNAKALDRCKRTIV